MIDPEFTEGHPTATDRTLRQFAALSIVVFGGIACWQGLVHNRPMGALIFAAFAVLIGPLGLLKPKAIRYVFMLAMAVATPIGWLVSHAVLALLFLGLFTPVAVFFKLIGRDALARRRRPEGQTYWVAHPVVRNVDSYFRQS